MEAVSGDGLAATMSHAMTQPAGTTDGNLLIAALSLRSTGDGATDPTWPEGWTQLANCTDYASSNGQIEVRYKVAASESGTTTVTSANSVASAYTMWRISGQHASSAPECAKSAVSSSANPDPPSLTPSWGADANGILYIAATAYDSGGSGANITGYPANYTSNQNEFLEVSQVGVASATRVLTTSPENPGTFTLDAADSQIAVTIAVRSAAASGTTGGMMMMGIGN